MKEIKLNENPLIFWGDNHGVWNKFQKYVRLNKNKNIIQVGDFGIGMSEKDWEYDKLYDLNEILNKNNIFIYIIRGNHDNPKFFVNKTNMKYFSHIIFLEDYSILVSENHKILLVGGAISVDRSLRKRWNKDLMRKSKDYLLWWENEIFVYNEQEIEFIKENHKDIDIIVTHSAPTDFYPIKINDFVRHWGMKDDLTRTKREKESGMDLIMELKDERLLLDKFYADFMNNETKIKYWFYGHFHDSNIELRDETEIILLNIDEIKEIL